MKILSFLLCFFYVYLRFERSLCVVLVLAAAAVCYRRHKEHACVPKQPLELLVDGYMTFDLGTLSSEAWDLREGSLPAPSVAESSPVVFSPTPPSP